MTDLMESEITLHNHPIMTKQGTAKRERTRAVKLKVRENEKFEFVLPVKWLKEYITKGSGEGDSPYTLPFHSILFLLPSE